MTSSGLTYGQIGAKQAEYVRDANGALTELRDRGCRWWLYSVSHCTFEVVVGEPQTRENVVISLAACDHIAGPVEWSNQRLRVVFHNNRKAEKPWLFVLEDESVGFKAVGSVFGWCRGYDLLEHGSLYMPRSRSGSGG
jgi:hypothetical protein